MEWKFLKIYLGKDRAYSEEENLILFCFSVQKTLQEMLALFFNLLLKLK